jgi:hypothetical protein
VYGAAGARRIAPVRFGVVVWRRAPLRQPTIPLPDLPLRLHRPDKN